VNLFIILISFFNKDFVRFGKGKVEVILWRCIVNLEWKMQSEADASMKSNRKWVESHLVSGGVQGYKENYYFLMVFED